MSLDGRTKGCLGLANGRTGCAQSRRPRAVGRLPGGDSEGVGRIGTPTGRAESGTVEEFERAYEQWKTEPDTIRLMMYFKNANVPFEDIDPDQIASVRQFKRSLGQVLDAFIKISNLRAHAVSPVLIRTRLMRRVGPEGAVPGYSLSMRRIHRYPHRQPSLARRLWQPERRP